MARFYLKRFYYKCKRLFYETKASWLRTHFNSCPPLRRPVRLGETAVGDARPALTVEPIRGDRARLNPGRDYLKAIRRWRYQTWMAVEALRPTQRHGLAHEGGRISLPFADIAARRT